MRDRPEVSDERIAAALQRAYGMTVAEINFLPIGNDAAAASFQARAGRDRFFVKLRRGAPNRASLSLAHFLRHSGIDGVVAPIATASGALFAELGEYSLVLYPWIDGESKWGKPISPRLWREWGAIMRAIHSASPGDRLAAQLPQEQYGKRWLDRLQRVERAVKRQPQPHAFASELADRWTQRAAQIAHARERYLRLGASLKARGQALVICHADIHPANIIVDAADAIHIVDWDEAMRAPKERDLMFFLVDGHGDDAVSAFLDGYGDVQVDQQGLAYYRYDWVLQEFCDYGERVFFSPTLSERKLRFSIDEFDRLFAPGDVLDLARQADADIRA